MEGLNEHLPSPLNCVADLSGKLCRTTANPSMLSKPFTHTLINGDSARHNDIWKVSDRTMRWHWISLQTNPRPFAPYRHPHYPKRFDNPSMRKATRHESCPKGGIGGQDVPHPVAKDIIARFGWFQTILTVTARFKCSWCWIYRFCWCEMFCLGSPTPWLLNYPAWRFPYGQGVQFVSKCHRNNPSPAMLSDWFVIAILVTFLCYHKFFSVSMDTVGTMKDNSPKNRRKW